ncbi:hypothetical protein D3C78_1288910 [compost metagenome]
MPRLLGDRPAWPALFDGLAQARAVLLQVRPPGVGRQGQDQRLEALGELQLFLVFGRVGDLPVAYRGRVIGRQVAEQMQGLGGVDSRVGEGSEAENADKGQQPDEKFGGAHKEGK